MPIVSGVEHFLYLYLSNALEKRINTTMENRSVLPYFVETNA